MNNTSGHKRGVTDLSRPRQPTANPFTNTSTVGLLQHSLAPSLGFHGALSVLTYAAARTTDRAELKDWLWPSGMLLNTWSTFLSQTAEQTPNISPVDAFIRLPWTHKLLLTGVSAWSTRLFFRIASRSIKRGDDDPRYTAAKKEPGFWNKALFAQYLPEAVFQAFITLPFTLPFRLSPTTGEALQGYSPGAQYAELLRGLAVGLFCSGFALEVLADRQLEEHKEEKGQQGLVRSGVWSIVRHPK
jgi:steroid 5-alpha reductase family enzyme